MWLFTPSGFLSIVADRQCPGHALVRARVREDLEAFCARTHAPAPTETPQRDYRFRTSVPLATLAAELATRAAAIDSPSFKSEVAARPRPRPRAPVWANLVGHARTAGRSVR
jgi:hypothetical protein